MEYFAYLSSLAIIVFVGIWVACKGFGYEISIKRMIVAAGLFAALSAVPIPIPIPFIGLLLPALGLYIALMDDTHDRSTVNKVFGFTYIFAVLVTLGLLHLTGRL